MSENEYGAGRSGMDDVIIPKAVHQRLQPPMATCLDCKQLVKAEDLGNHYLKICGESCGLRCCRQKCMGRSKGNCISCGGLVYPYLANGKEIRFYHSCTRKASQMCSKYICEACSGIFDSREEFDCHMDTGCYQLCPRCRGPIFKKRSIFGVIVDHICYTA